MNNTLRRGGPPPHAGIIVAGVGPRRGNAGQS